MVTGASTADLAIVLVDARQGVVEQSRRHAFLTALLGVPHLVVAVNKMDLVAYEEGPYDAVRAEFSRFADQLGVEDVRYLPISALRGDNVVERSHADALVRRACAVAPPREGRGRDRRSTAAGASPSNS